MSSIGTMQHGKIGSRNLDTDLEANHIDMEKNTYDYNYGYYVWLMNRKLSLYYSYYVWLIMRQINLYYGYYVWSINR